MELAIIVNLAVIAVVVIGLIIVLVFRQKPYTAAQWNEKLKEDFKRFGPVPDNED
ncbi:hypothetical protein [Thalassobellus citreus]|uniref:hypothetical protein n=1 Tax=Thalassobellus citreus TaxID=3367752 RepID=UPI0037AAD77B